MARSGPVVLDRWSSIGGSSFPEETADAEADDGGDSDGDGKIDPAGFEVGTGGAPVYIDYDGNQRLGASVSNAHLKLSEYVSMSGNLQFEKGPTYRVDVKTNLPGDFVNLINTAADLIPEPVEAFFQELTGNDADFTKLENIDVESLQVGASDVTAFVGMGGPYWNDLDQDNAISWVAPAVDGNGQIIQDQYVTLTDGSDADNFVDITTVDGVQYGDVNKNGIVDAAETFELNNDATGLALTNFRRWLRDDDADAGEFSRAGSVHSEVLRVEG